MRISFKGKTQQAVLNKIREYLYETGQDTPPQPADEDEEPAPKTTVRTKKPTKAEQKANDLAAKTETAKDAAPPAPPAPVGASGKGGTPAEPDGRLPRPLCKEHGKDIDTTKFKLMVVGPDRCFQCVTEKDATAQTPTVTADDVKAALNAVGDTFADPKLGDAKIFEILGKYGADSVNNPKVPKEQHLKPEHYHAVMNECADWCNPNKPAKRVL